MASPQSQRGSCANSPSHHAVKDPIENVQDLTPPPHVRYGCVRELLVFLVTTAKAMACFRSRERARRGYVTCWHLKTLHRVQGTERDNTVFRHTPISQITNRFQPQNDWGLRPSRGLPRPCFRGQRPRRLFKLPNSREPRRHLQGVKCGWQGHRGSPH